MDHLPRFGHSVEPYPRIPYLCTEEYDGLPFAEYHIRHGWEVGRLYKGDFSQHGRDETASFLQKWLFFGAIQEIFGYQKPFDTKHLVLDDDQGKRVCTSSLNNHFAVWSARMEELVKESVEECRAALTRFGVCLNTIYQICKGLAITNDSPLPAEVTLSFSILGCTIDHALQWYWGLGRGRNWDLNTTATIRMMQAGWCPRDIAMASDTLAEIPLYCASYMARPTTPGEHDNCTPLTCEVNQVDEKSYVTKHHKDGCQCAHIVPNQDEVCKILDKGEIPVISIIPKRQSDGTRKFDVSVKAGGPIVHYFVAISHVWSDGLGNPFQNSLPACQIERIYDLLGDTVWDEIYDAMETMGDDIAYNDEGTKKAVEVVAYGFKKFIGPGLKKIVNPVRNFRGRPLSIWIDTISIPLEKEHRKLGISRMQDVYAKAAFTIVFDSELMTMKSRQCAPEELLTRIGLSGWFRRAWTFQEGVLANTRLRILFADAIGKVPLGPMDEVRTVEIGYMFPRLVTKMQNYETRIGNYADRHGVARPPVNEIEKSRLEEQVEYKKCFTMEKHMFVGSKKFFSGMQSAWMLGVGWAEPADQVQRINEAWEALRWRMTSRENDKFICFAIACTNGYKDRAQIVNLLSLPAEDRLKTWIQIQEIVPASFLFLPGPRYQDPGSRWMPKGVYREPLADTSHAERDPITREMVFTKPGYILSPTAMLTNTFQISDQATSLRYTVTLHPTPPTTTPNIPVDHGDLAIILSQKIGQRQPEYDHYKEVGALLANLRKTEGKMYGDYVCRVEVALLDGEGSEEGLVAAHPVVNNQGWVIS